MLYYIHGYLSDPNSTKGTLFKKTLNAKPIKYRNCKPEELIISECLENIKKEIKKDSDVVLIGSSLGGFLAVETAIESDNINKLILLNPAIMPKDYDITKIKDMPQSILKDMKDPRLFDKKIKADITILIGTLDDVVPNNWSVEFAKSQQATIKFYHDDHSFTKNIKKLPNIIKKVIEQKD
jgi:predicted esterase YcpF (UPF0227 family)